MKIAENSGRWVRCLRALSSRVLALALLAGFQGVAAIKRSEWRLNQTVEIAAAGLVKTALPAETLGALRAEAPDLRLLDTAGAEVGWFLERPLRFTPDVPVRRVKSFQTTLQPRVTVLTMETGVSLPIGGLALESGTGSFLKAARIEGSSDGRIWDVLAAGVPFYQNYQGQTRLQTTFSPQSWSWLRVSLDDARSVPVPFTDARLQVITVGDVLDVENRTLPVLSRDELPRETRLTLDLGSANLDLAAIRVGSSDGPFTRAISLRVPSLDQGEWGERILARGFLHRDLTPEGGPAPAPARFELAASCPVRRPVLVIENGDSPPVSITGITAEVTPVQLVFFAQKPGRYRLLAGNRVCRSPQYDLAAFSEQIRGVAPQAASFGALVANPEYRALAAEMDPFIQGAALDPTGWNYRKLVTVSQAGPQVLELDFDVFMHARPDFADLRLVSGGNQRSFVREANAGIRTVPVEPVSANDSKRPAFSRWRLKLSHAGLPLLALTVESSTALFDRAARLFETVSDGRSESWRHELGEVQWRRTPGETPGRLALSLSARPMTDTLWLEIRDGDNGPIEIGKAAFTYPATRLHFLSRPTPPIWLYYGNPHAAAPQYDLQLVADRLLTADGSPCNLGTEESGNTAGWRALTLGGRGIWLFWTALGVVVVTLLLVLRRLLPPIL